MNQIYLIALFVAVLGGFTYWVLPSTRWRLIGTVAFFCFGGVTFAGGFELVGIPKPYFLEWRDLTHKQLLSWYPDEPNQIIYVWLMVDGQPRQYALPWSQKEAEKIQDGLRQLAGEDGGTGEYLDFSIKRDGSADVIHILRPPLPPKE
jgi:hypothetical protein